MQNRIIIHLLPEEREALQQMAEQDVRPPDAQIRFLLISEAVRRGLLNALNNANGDAPSLPTDRIAVAV